MSVMIAGLFVYPVKSCAGIFITRADLDQHGIQFDRQWAVVHAATGRAVTQRETPTLACVRPAFHLDGVLVTADGMPELRVPVSGKRIASALISGDRCVVYDQGKESARWFSDFLGFPCRLVRYNPQAPRALRGLPGSVSFVDAYPLLVIGAASLEDLNARLGTPIPMSRFRPNVLVSGCPSYDEDAWQEWRVGNVSIRMVQPCARCVVTTTDQITGERDSAEPLRTLGQYRRWVDSGGKGGVIFGMNAAHNGPGVLRVGDEIQILSRDDL